MGLSPRLRGNRLAVLDFSVMRGSIPASAGEPTFWATSRLKPGVYPRVCGGTTVVEGVGVEPKGLSPRLRGNRNEFQTLVLISGSIPASAGEPISPTTETPEIKVYPRVCGGTLTPNAIGEPP